jgi:hypothetical protein
MTLNSFDGTGKVGEDFIYNIGSEYRIVERYSYRYTFSSLQTCSNFYVEVAANPRISTPSKRLEVAIQTLKSHRTVRTIDVRYK